MSEDKPAPKTNDKWIVKPTINMKYAITIAMMILVAIAFGSIGYTMAPAHSTITDTSTVTTTVSVITALYGNYTIIPSSNTNTPFGLSTNDLIFYGFLFLMMVIGLIVLIRRVDY